MGAQPPPSPPSPPPPSPRPPSAEAALASASAAAVANAFGLPPARRCLHGRNLVITLKTPAGVTIKKASITVRGKTIKARRVGGRPRATVELLGGKKRRLTVALKVTTASGKIL